MVTAVHSDAELRQRAWDTAAGVVDPEIPVLTIADLGVLRDVAVNDGCVEVAITPTYSGCPAMNMITLEIELALEREGFCNPKVRTVLSPAWTTDWMSEDGRRKLAAPAARCSAPNRWRARNVAPRIPSCCRSSARPPARRCGAAKAAANRSTILNVIEHVLIDTALSSPGRERSAPRIR
jgi:phenylacetate-CoA oxygenase PaaJ subunit